MELYQKLKHLVNEMEQDFHKFYEKGNNAAGTRIRKSMQNLKKLAQEIRAEVQSKKKAE
jgi:hypothetical protein